MKSIIQDNKECYFCHKIEGIALHHCFPGRNRKASDKYGFVVYLCHNHHVGNEGVHRDNQSLSIFKRLCQAKFEQTHTRKEFIKIIGKSYLEE